MRLPASHNLSVRTLMIAIIIGLFGAWGCGPATVGNYPAPPDDPWFKKQVVDQKQPVLVVFGAVWCGYCKQARQYLKQKGIPFQDRDVENEAGASAELARKCAQAKIRGNGVPVLDVRGKLIVGFSAQAIDAALAR